MNTHQANMIEENLVELPPAYPSLSVIIPVYNSQEILDELVSTLDREIEKLSSQYEVILVNDASRDKSWDVICKLASKYPWITGINLMRNYGQHNALLCGIRAAKYEVVITMDDDLQNPPAEILHLLDKLSQGHDVVYGTPDKELHGLWRDLSSQVTKLALQTIIGAETARNISSFRAFRTQVRDAFANYQSPFLSIDVLLTWGTTRFSSVKVRHDIRRQGQSNYTFRKLITHALNMMTGFSTLPLQFASWIGFCSAFFGLMVLVYVIGRYLLLGYSVPGFPFLASIIAIFSGAQLFSIGIIGEYLARMHFRTMERPAYTIRSITIRD
jgi:glycosyltransferase involved in cell wall biosynthesis